MGKRTLRFHELCQSSRAGLFFAAIRFQILLMRLAVITFGFFNSVAPVFIVLIFMTRA
jgi:hypothetical protein